MGTGEFAAPSLAVLIAANYSVVAVYTKPLSAHGRSRTKAVPNPVRARAERHAIPVHDPAGRLSDADTLATLRSLAPDIIIVAAYGNILPQSVLDLPRHGCVNVHASLLPRWRGASPIHAAIRAGDTQTGVTIMRMDAGLDTGPIIAQKSRAITPHMHTPELFVLLADDGARLLVEVLPDYLRGVRVPQPQSTHGVTTCRTLTRDDGHINWHDTTQSIYNQFRAYDPWPGIFTLWHRDAANAPLRLKLTDIRPCMDAPRHMPGTVFSTDTHPLCVATADGALVVKRVQLQGKNDMDARAFVNGYGDIITARLGEMW